MESVTGVVTQCLIRKASGASSPTPIMPHILATAPFLAHRILHPLFTQQPIRFPSASPNIELPEQFVEIVRGLRTIVTRDAVPAAYVLGNGIVVSWGFLCERWCTTYRLGRVYGQRDLVGFDLVVPNPADEFEWPADIPAPWAQDELVGNTNKAYLPVVCATLLHEIAHPVFRGSGTRQAIELRCDHFSMNYLLGRQPLEAIEFRLVGVCIWLCALCSETLGQDGLRDPHHPHPVRRVEQFLVRFVEPSLDRAHPLKAATVWFCALHIWNLARLRRPEPFDYAMDDFHETNSADPMVLLDVLRQCWE